MGYDLIPRSNKIKAISVGAFSWPIILQETGAGYVVGYGAAKSPASYVYRPDDKGASPVSNDGYAISAEDARSMAKCMRGYVSVKRYINKEWAELSEDERKYEEAYKTDGRDLYQKGVHEDRLKQIESIADFLEASQGFRIH